MVEPRIESVQITIACICGKGDILITMMSMLYHDAKCPHCGKIWTAQITIKEDE